MPNKYEILALNNPALFMQKYCLLVHGASAQAMNAPNAAGGTSLADEYRRLGFTTTPNQAGAPRQSGISLTAPLVSAVIQKTEVRAFKDVLPFTRPLLTVKFEAYQPGVGVPAYLIPYEGDRGRGVKLPAHGSDAHDPVLCFTATQNGCTVEVSGLAGSPYASHTNVYSVQANQAQNQFQAKCAAMATRINRLQRRFDRAERLANPGPTTVGVNRRQFNNFPAAPGLGAGGEVNYRIIGNQIVANKDGGYIFLSQTSLGGDVDQRFAALRGVDRSDPQAFYANFKAILMGRRTNQGWSFFYQVHAKLRFGLISILNGDPATEAPYSIGGRTEVEGGVVLDHGDFWPNRTSHPW